MCTGLNSLSPYNNEAKSSHNLCYNIFSSFVVLVPEVPDEGVDGVQAISEAEFNGLFADPNFSAEKFVAVSDEPTSAAVLDVGLKIFVNLVEQVLDDGGLGLVDWPERIIDQFPRAGGEDSSLDPELVDGLVEAEAGRDGANAAHDRTGKRQKHLER